MTLPEAIRLGAKIRPQSVGISWHDGKSCALAAAYEVTGGEFLKGAGDPDYFLIKNHLNKVWPGLMDHPVDLPSAVSRHEVYGDDPTILSAAIVELNDHHGWTREQIADWVEEQIS